jgi:hypothetical protein
MEMVGEGFADHLYALLPKGFGVGGVKGVAADPFCHQAYGFIIGDDGAFLFH